jgi:shikimate dehydrogenase
MSSDVSLKAGVMGWPIAHSLSPRLHNYWLKKYGIEGSYEALAIPPEKLAQELHELPEQGFRGVNLTIPHKEDALMSMDELDPIAQRVGSVNTVVVRADGSLEGRNSDVYGFAQNLLKAGVDVRAGPATILGAGGSARAVIVALQDMGVEEIRIVNRTTGRAEALKRQMGGMIEVFPWDRARSAMDGATLLVNATSLGMQGQPPLEVTIDGLARQAAVTDLVYRPLITDLLLRAQKRGHRIVDGLGMLLHQARPAFAAFFGKDPEVTDELRHYVLEQK